jgi:hypothetical protein
MAKRKSSGNGVPMAGAKIETNPESENELREQEANAERERLLDELGRCFVQAAVTRPAQGTGRGPTTRNIERSLETHRLVKAGLLEHGLLAAFGFMPNIA